MTWWWLVDWPHWFSHLFVFSPPQIVAYRPVQRLLCAGVCVRGARWRPTHGGSEGGGAGVTVPPGALWDWGHQTHAHLQSGPQVWGRTSSALMVEFFFFEKQRNHQCACFAFFLFQGKISRMVQQSVWLPVCKWSSEDPVLFSPARSDEHRGQDLNPRNPRLSLVTLQEQLTLRTQEGNDPGGGHFLLLSSTQLYCTTLSWVTITEMHILARIPFISRNNKLLVWYPINIKQLIWVFFFWIILRNPRLLI